MARDPLLHLLDAGDRLEHRRRAGLAARLGARRQLRLARGVLGDLRRRARQLLHGGGDLDHRRRLLRRARGELRGDLVDRVGRRGHLDRAVLDLLRELRQRLAGRLRDLRQPLGEPLRCARSSAPGRRRRAARRPRSAPPPASTSGRAPPAGAAPGRGSRGTPRGRSRPPRRGRGRGTGAAATPARPPTSRAPAGDSRRASARRPGSSRAGRSRYGGPSAPETTGSARSDGGKGRLCVHPGALSLAAGEPRRPAGQTDSRLRRPTRCPALSALSNGA